jgi:hypothetical protein
MKMSVLQSTATSLTQHGGTMAPQDQLHHAMALLLTILDFPFCMREFTAVH